MNRINLTLPEKTVLPQQNKAEPETLPGFFRQNYVPLLLGLTLLLAFFLRIYDITGNPNGLNQDEAVNGVDAFSLGQTLRDHHGNFLPVIFESFEDWSSSLLTYLSIPFIWVLGLSEFSVRLPVVLLGVATGFLMYLYVKKLTNRPHLALLAAFLLAVMPWHIMYSRWGHPASVVPFFVLLLLYVNSLVGPTETRLWKFGVIGFCAVLLASTYPTQKMFVPLLLGVFLLADFFNKIPLKVLITKYLMLGLTFLALTSPVYLMAFFDPKTNTRFNYVSIFGLYKDPYVEILIRYFNYFSPLKIFEGYGTFIFLVVFNYLGIASCIHRAIFKNSIFSLINRQQALIILGWWLITPIPASLTRDSYNPMRVIHGFPLTIIFSVVGLALVGDLLKTQVKQMPRLSPAFYGVILALSAGFLAFFYVGYLNQYKESSKEQYQYGIRQFSEYLVQRQADFDNVTVDSHINQPYIYYLFYSKEDPHRYNYAEITYLKNGQDGIRGIPKLDNYIYAKIQPETIAGATELLAVKDETGRVWYKVYARGRQWYVRMEYDNGYDSPA